MLTFCADMLAETQRHKELEEDKKRVRRQLHVQFSQARAAMPVCCREACCGTTTAQWTLQKAFPAVQRADAEAAKLYEEFVESFGDGAGDGEGGAAPRAFVRGGTIQPGSSAAAAAAAGAPQPNWQAVVSSAALLQLQWRPSSRGSCDSVMANNLTPYMLRKPINAAQAPRVVPQCLARPNSMCTRGSGRG